MRATFLQGSRFVFGLLALLLASAGSSRAQSLEPDPRAEQALACLQRVGDAQITHPSGEGSGFVRLKLTFKAADQPPEIEFVTALASPTMQEKAARYAQDYRLPCLTPGEAPLVTTQEFAFNPYANVKYAPLQAFDGRSLEDMCLVMKQRAPERTKKMNDLLDGIYNTMLSYTFDGAGDQPPKITVLYSSPKGRAWEDAVQKTVSEYRMPCRKAGDPPMTLKQTFTYRQNSPAPRFPRNAIALDTFLRMVKDLRTQQVSFDFKEMACPFQVNWENMRPVRPNRAAAIGKPDIRRTAFLQWLSTQELNLGEANPEAFLGEQLKIDIPCSELRLTS